MDPQQAWSDLSKAVDHGNWLKATEIAEELVEWMGKGGFPPTLTGKTNFDRIVVNAACQAIACWEFA